MDIDQFRAKPNTPRVQRKPRKLPRHKAGEWFIKGPIPGGWIGQAAALPGASLHVALAVWHLAEMGKDRSVKATRTAWVKFGISQHAANRGLCRLEGAGLVSVVRCRGCCPVVTIEVKHETT